MGKPLRSIDPTPPLIGLAVGLGEGAIAYYKPGTHNRTYYRAAVAAAGLYGDKMGNWNPDIAIGMLTAVATLQGASLANKFGGGPNSGALFPYQSGSAHATSGHAASVTPNGVRRYAPMGPTPNPIPSDIVTMGDPNPANLPPRQPATPSGGPTTQRPTAAG